MLGDSHTLIREIELLHRLMRDTKDVKSKETKDSRGTKNYKVTKLYKVTKNCGGDSMGGVRGVQCPR